MPRLVGFIVLALIIFFIVTQPEAAADTVRYIGATLVDFFDAFITFFAELA